MSATRSAPLGLLVVFALSLALASASASAATPEWWVEGKLLTGTEKLAEEESKAAGNVVIKSEKLTVECTTVTVQGGTIAKSSNSTSAVVFAGCKLAAPSGCEAKIKTEPLTFPLEEPGLVVKLKFKPKSGSLIAAFTIEGTSCTLKGKVVELTTSGEAGGMDCNYPDVEKESLEHTLEFTKTSGSEFKVNKEPGEFIATFKWKLASKKLFSVQ
ncbi:MAG: hypothetical protein JWN10_1097 [Solirubrobacterales bacterium]|nr:hypothetical protein [Solirubrobacterales bacterium]